ncbi:hypothetical protein LTS18_009617 [Coniosporium uncinatum]|uniref:Uncharacterized protein n=1 Tax=Coniosporium uncinatum TaxID=93489 RepID=A0ACC3DWT2_9PEZI|nr:hypothetical protein LTS18_009617 [Coniosporium uncinatum]
MTVPDSDSGKLAEILLSLREIKDMLGEMGARAGFGAEVETPTMESTQFMITPKKKNSGQIAPQGGSLRRKRQRKTSEEKRVETTPSPEGGASAKRKTRRTNAATSAKVKKVLRFEKEEGEDEDEDRASKRRRHESVSSEGSSGDDFVESPSRRQSVAPEDVTMAGALGSPVEEAGEPAADPVVEDTPKE